MRKGLAGAIGLLLCVSSGFAGAEEAKYPNMVLVPAGEFTMGLNMEDTETLAQSLGGQSKHYEAATPIQKITVDAFYIDIYEVTNKDYKKFVEATKHKVPFSWEESGGDIPEGKADHPVVNVTWFDAVDYCKWAGKRLPTEAEWEKVARGKEGTYFPWGNKFNKSLCNTGESMKENTMPVGKFPKGVSSYGCYDMIGNAWEWTADNYLPYPGSMAQDEFFGKERYVARGGSYFTDCFDAVSIFREKYTPVSDYEDVGFRCVKSAE